MTHPTTPRLVVIGSCGWMALVVALLVGVALRDARPGDQGQSAAAWPRDTVLALAPTGTTVVLMAHPRCPCTPASLDELEAVLRAVRAPVRAYVLVVRPAGAEPGFEDGPVWARTHQLPGVVPLLDTDGREAARFGARTSGHVVAYDPTGALVFAGGITGAKGCAGDNPARRALIQAIDQVTDAISDDQTPIYGCSLTGCEQGQD